MLFMNLSKKQIMNKYKILWIKNYIINDFLVKSIKENIII